jgi:hypothetical protein
MCNMNFDIFRSTERSDKSAGIGTRTLLQKLFICKDKSVVQSVQRSERVWI